MAFKKKSYGRGMSKLQRSNAAHERLRDKNGYGYVKGDMVRGSKYLYHGSVCSEQTRLGRVLTPKEKSAEFSKAREKMKRQF